MRSTQIFVCVYARCVCMTCMYLVLWTYLLEQPLLCPLSLGMLWFSFHSIFKNVLISFQIFVLTHLSFSSEFFNFHQFVGFLLLLISSFNPWWSDRMQDVTSIFLYLLRLALCLSIWSIFEIAPWAAEKVFYFALEQNVL